MKGLFDGPGIDSSAGAETSGGTTFSVVVATVSGSSTSAGESGLSGEPAAGEVFCFFLGPSIDKHFLFFIKKISYRLLFDYSGDCLTYCCFGFSLQQSFPVIRFQEMVTGIFNIQCSLCMEKLSLLNTIEFTMSARTSGDRYLPSNLLLTTLAITENALSVEDWFDLSN